VVLRYPKITSSKVGEKILWSFNRAIAWSSFCALLIKISKLTDASSTLEQYSLRSTPHD